MSTEPSWLQPAIDQRLALMLESMGEEMFSEMAKDGVIMMTPLTEPKENATTLEHEYWDRSCDNCGRYVKPFADDESVQLMTGHKRVKLRGAYIVISFGACTLCATPDDVA